VGPVRATDSDLSTSGMTRVRVFFPPERSTKPPFSLREKVPGGRMRGETPAPAE